MDVWLLGKSMSIGLAVAAPVGPMSMLCMQRTLQQGWQSGLTFGAGIAAADGTYAALPALGVTAVSTALLAGIVWIKLAGSAILLYLGIRIALARPAQQQAAAARIPACRSFVTGYALTVTNPPTLLFFASLFASIASLASDSQALVFSAGVFAGSLLWWIILTAVVQRGKHRLTSVVLLWVNRICGAALIVFACYAAAGLAIGA